MQNVPFHIIRCVGTNKVLDIEGGDSYAGSRVICYERNNPSTPNQLWRLEDQGGGRCFISSAANPNLVLDVQGGQAYDGVQIVVYDRNFPPSENQQFLWQNGIIKSCLPGNLVIDCALNPNDPYVGDALLYTSHGGDNQRWAIDYV